MNKEFGKYSTQQLKEFVRLLQSRSLLQKEWQTLVNNEPEKVFKALASGFYWSEIYALSFLEQVSFFAVVGGIDSRINTMSTAVDPQDAALNELKREMETLGDPSDLEPHEAFEPKVLLGNLIAVIKNLDSIWHYGMPINDLVAQVSNGNDDALLKAIRIDRSITSCPPIADRIAKAEIEQDEQFFKLLRNALRGPSKKPMDAYGPLRYVLYQLEDDGVLEQMTTKDRFDLFCTELDLYPSKNNDAEKSLDTFIRRWRKTLAT
ncbi:MAG: hypothetical protein OQL20_09465 [Sedimenticola sp.]|nr:hypothetical protein [Sedimenticola sp.]